MHSIATELAIISAQLCYRASYAPVIITAIAIPNSREPSNPLFTHGLHTQQPQLKPSHRDCIKHHIRLCLSRVNCYRAFTATNLRLSRENCYRAFTATNLLAVTLAMLLVSVELLAPWLRCEEAAKLARCCLSSYTSPGLVARQDTEARSRQTFEDERDRTPRPGSDSSAASPYSLGFSEDSDGHWHEHDRDEWQPQFFDRNDRDLWFFD